MKPASAFAALALASLATSLAHAAPFDLSALPEYRPTQAVSGTIRNFGFGMDGLLKLWEQDFRAFQPNVRFEDRLPTSDAAIPALVTGVADLAPDGGEPIITETLSFYETTGHHPTAITVASGAYDVEGHSNGPVVYVSRDNPLAQLTLQQLDGIFGAPRTGSLEGFKWSLAGARTADADIRTWGQLGLTGEWAGKPIQTYGHAPSGTTRFFQLKVMHNSDKWNPNYREYVESGSKMIADDDPAQQGGLQHMLRDELARDRFGIAWTVMPQARGVEGLKAIAIAPDAASAFVAPSRESFQSRAYPLVRSIYMYLDRAPGHAVDPKLKEFLRFILSRQGQERLMAHGGYLPLTAAMVETQRLQLDETGAVGGVAPLAPYRPARQVDGAIRLWGHGRRDADVLGGLVAAWQAGLRATQPTLTLVPTLRGDATAIGGLYTGAADIAVMERDLLPIELDGYLPVMGHAPQQVDIATGSLDQPDHAYAPVVLVHRDNPLAHLDLAQLDAILGADRRRGGAPVRTWGDLGVGGAWKDRPITIYLMRLEEDVARFIEKRVMNGSQKWSANLHEFGADATAPAGRRIVDALARDPYGIAIACACDATAQVKPVALAFEPRGPFVAPTRATVQARQYPLARPVSLFVDRTPRQPLAPKPAEFLAYVLSADGQAAIARDGGYLPLPPDTARHEQEKLK